jgi:hypothetical protein
MSRHCPISISGLCIKSVSANVKDHPACPDHCDLTDVYTDDTLEVETGAQAPYYRPKRRGGGPKPPLLQGRLARLRAD